MFTIDAGWVDLDVKPPTIEELNTKYAGFAKRLFEKDKNQTIYNQRLKRGNVLVETAKEIGLGRDHTLRRKILVKRTNKLETQINQYTSQLLKNLMDVLNSKGKKRFDKDLNVINRFSFSNFKSKVTGRESLIKIQLKKFHSILSALQDSAPRTDQENHIIKLLKKQISVMDSTLFELISDNVTEYVVD